MRLSVVIVAYGGDLTPTLAALAEQRGEGDEVVVVDNLAAAGGTQGLREAAGIDRLVEPDRNLGFAAGANRGAAVAGGDAIVLLNPDAVPAPGCLDALRRPPVEWDAWMALVTLRDGVTVNTAGGTVHPFGFAWVGRLGEPAGALGDAPLPVGFLSGACLAVRTGRWSALGGFPEDFFMYQEDVELSLRLRLAGASFGVLPSARVRHDYVFARGAEKWRLLESNRWATVLRTYPGPVLLGVLPGMLAAEPALLVYALLGGWGRAKVASWLDVGRRLPRLLRERREVQRSASVTPAEFARGFSPSLRTPLLGAVGRSRSANGLSALYWRVVLAALGR